ncbi:MAG: tyrosine-type recombinase/integrase [Bacteroidales bacterium]|nr:tyrosine-type recombinase/integrase [Bacteroidales bacterium]
MKNLDPRRKMLSVRGKGDKMRDIPLIDDLLSEIKAYLKAVEIIWGETPDGDDPLFVTPNRGPLYPVYIDKAIKEALSSVPGITGKKSPHVLRHTLATGLLNNGTDLNSIKELLGHSSLAATQVYTHNSIEKMKSVYAKAHPRAKDNTKEEE